jgi:hypothetical protein
MTPRGLPSRPVVALISATPAAVKPIEDSLRRHFAPAIPWNIIDDRLLTRVVEDGGVTPPLAARMKRLISHALTEEADAVLLTCSMYGRVAHGTVSDTLVLASDDAAFDALLTGGFTTVLFVASLSDSLSDAETRFAEAASGASSQPGVVGVVAEGALAAVKTGETAALAAALANACAPFAAQVDAVFLAQYSLAGAASALESALGRPVISGPDSSALLLRSRLGGAEA